MKLQLFLAFIILLVYKVNSQTMLTDPGFDFCDSWSLNPTTDCTGPGDCPASENDSFWYAWHQPTSGTSDQFNSCITGSGGWGTQNNIYGSGQIPRSNNGFGGIIVYNRFKADTTFGRNLYKEYLAQNWVLNSGIDPMEAGHEYCFSFYVTLSSRSTIAIDKFGVLFHDQDYINTDYVLLGGTSQLGTSLIPASWESPDGVYYTDTTNWTLISGTYVAQGGETTIIIGSFTKVADIDTISVLPPNHLLIRSAYYIEDVCLSPIETCLCDGTEPTGFPSNELIVNVPNVFTPNGDGENDYFGMIDNLENDVIITIYNRWGEKVFNSYDWAYFPWNGKKNDKDVPEGIYYYVITANNFQSKTGFIHLNR